jgi:hypothetical protein
MFDLKGDTNLRILFGSCNCFDAGHFDFEFAHRIHPRRPLTILNAVAQFARRYLRPYMLSARQEDWRLALEHIELMAKNQDPVGGGGRAGRYLTIYPTFPTWRTISSVHRKRFSQGRCPSRCAHMHPGEARVPERTAPPHGLVNAVENRKQHLAPSSAAWSVFTCHYQGVSHAAWPEDKHESASKETIC